MTRKDYKLLAACFARHLAAARFLDVKYGDFAEIIVQALIADCVADLQRDNKRFNPEKFLRAAGAK